MPLFRGRKSARQMERPPNSLNLPPHIYSFLMGIADECGVPLDPFQKEEMIREMAGDFNFFMAGGLMHVLSPQAFDEYTRLNAANRSPAEIHAFLAANLPDVQAFFAACFIGFRNLYLAS